VDGLVIAGACAKAIEAHSRINGRSNRTFRMIFSSRVKAGLVLVISPGYYP